MKIVIIDGQGGKIGKSIIEGLRKRQITAEIFAIGTNSIATSVMMKAGADFAATGENAVVVNCRDADIIAGPIGIVIADSLLGEVTPKMAVAVGQSSAYKLLLPINKCKNYIVSLNDDISVTDIVQKAQDFIIRLSLKSDTF